MISGIYKITSPSGKIYIGQSIDIENRFIYYKYLKCKSQTKIYNSLLKYGYDNHIFEIIDICDVNSLNTKERYYQDSFNCVESGLNCSYTKTNDKSGKHSVSTINNIKKSLIGVIKKKPIPMKESTKKLISAKTKQRLSNKENHHLFGKKHSEETISKIKNTKMLNPSKVLTFGNHQNSKIVLDIQNGVFYESVKELSLLYNINYSTLKNKLSNNTRLKNNTNFIYV